MRGFNVLAVNFHVNFLNFRCWTVMLSGDLHLHENQQNTVTTVIKDLPSWSVVKFGFRIDTLKLTKL